MVVRLRFWFILALNILLVCASLVSAWLLRFEFTLPIRHVLFAALPILLAMRLTGLARFNLLHGYWRYTGLSDVTDILKATFLSTVGFLLVERYLLGVVAFPKSIYCLEGLLAVGMLCGVRLISRTVLQAAIESSHDNVRKRVIVVWRCWTVAGLWSDIDPAGHRSAFRPAGCTGDRHVYARYRGQRRSRNGRQLRLLLGRRRIGHRACRL